MDQFFRLPAMLVPLSTIAFGQSSGKTRAYYIAADEVDWDHAPGGVNKMMGMKFDGYSKVFTERGPLIEPLLEEKSEEQHRTHHTRSPSGVFKLHRARVRS